MKRFMLDFETLGSGQNACVIQIGCMSFDGKDQYKCNVEISDSLKNGAQVAGDTLYWWFSQSPEAIASVIKEPHVTEREAFTALNTMLARADEVWSHSTFDFVTLQETLRSLGIKSQVGYRTSRDIRTLIGLVKVIKPDYVTDAKREGIHHDALDDCKYQIGYCIEALKILGVKVPQLHSFT